MFFITNNVIPNVVYSKLNKKSFININVVVKECDWDFPHSVD